MEESEKLPNGKSYEVDEIFAGTPEDHLEEVEEGTVNDSDFADPDEVEDATLLEEINDNYHEAKDKREEEPELVESEDVREKELSDKAKEIKKEFISMINPKTVVSFADFALSRGGSALMLKTDKTDWRLDPEEKEFLTQVLEVMIEEEGIEFWPAKVWLILALIFFYGMKVMDNYTKYYSKSARLQQNPQQVLEMAKQKSEAELVALKVAEMELEVKERRARVLARTMEVEKAIRNGEAPPAEPKDEKDPTEIEKELVRQQYPPEKYVYKDGQLQFNKDGSPTKKRGGAFGQVKKHPVTGHFMNNEDYKALVLSGEIDEFLTDEERAEYLDQENEEPEAEFVETEEVN